LATLFAYGALSACADQPEAGPLAEGATGIDIVLLADPLSEPQATSLFGESLYAKPDTSGLLAEVDEALRADPDNVERLIAAARERRNLWQYRPAMILYSRAAELAPEDWRPYRYRGHRHLSVREFDAGIEDLERARGLAPTNWDVAYHLGLAYFLSGRFGDAADEYVRCLDLADDADAQAAQSDDFRSCSQNYDDLESRVAMTEWAVRALLRADRGAEADSLLSGIEPGWPIEENLAYYDDLLFHKDQLDEAALMKRVADGTYRLETVGYGIVNQLLVRGDTVRAREILETLVDDPWWPGFGRLAAEAELARLNAGAP